MGRHIFNFLGGDELTTMGAAWFVSYCWFQNIDHTHLNWSKVSTYKNRISVYENTKQYHTFYLIQIALMNEKKLNKNTIDLSGFEVLEMAKKLSEIKIK